MTKLSRDHLLDLSKKLIAIESTAQNLSGLREAYNLVVKMLRNCGKEITIEEFESNGKPSLLAYMGDKRPDRFHIILNGHVDVVPGAPDQYQPHVKNGRLYGRGAHDMKPAVVILTDIFCEYVDKVPYALGLQVVTDEESSGYDGARYQVNQGVRSDFVLSGECGRLPTKYEIANEAKGMIFAEIGFKGKASHGAYPWRGDNALAHATRFAHILHELYPIPEAETFETTVSVTNIGTSNTAYSKVPDDAILKIDIRYPKGDETLSTKEKLTAFIKNIDPRAQILSLPEFSSPVFCEPSDNLLQCLKAAAEKVESHPFDFVMRHGTFDGRFFAARGDRACEFGIAGEHQHADNENITLRAFDNYHATMCAFLDSTIALDS